MYAEKAERRIEGAEKPKRWVTLSRTRVSARRRARYARETRRDAFWTLLASK